VESETCDWFPHLSLNDELANYISFPPGTLGHLPDMDVQVRLVRTPNWRDVARRFPLFGRQGTIKVNS
jgi:TolB protein